MEIIQIYKVGKSLHRTNDYQVINKLCNCSELKHKWATLRWALHSLHGCWMKTENKVCWWQTFLWVCRRRWYANGLHTSPDGVCLCPWLHRWGQRREWGCVCVCVCGCVCGCVYVCVCVCVCVFLRGMDRKKDKKSGKENNICPLIPHCGSPDYPPRCHFVLGMPQDKLLDGWFFWNNCFFCFEILNTFQPQLWRKT